MGWLFSERWLQRKDLIEHLVNGNGIKTLKHCTVGNNLWCVHEGVNRNGTRVVFICLYMMKGPQNCSKGYTGCDKDWWGYKDVDESAGPCHYSCPRAYLDMCTYPVNQYAYDWRQKVYRRYEHMAKMKTGVRIKFRYTEYTIIKRMGPSCFYLETDSGYRCKAGINVMAHAEVMQ